MEFRLSYNGDIKHKVDCLEKVCSITSLSPNGLNISIQDHGLIAVKNHKQIVSVYRDYTKVLQTSAFFYFCNWVRSGVYYQSHIKNCNYGLRKIFIQRNLLNQSHTKLFFSQYFSDESFFVTREFIESTRCLTLNHDIEPSQILFINWMEEGF